MSDRPLIRSEAQLRQLRPGKSVKPRADQGYATDLLDAPGKSRVREDVGAV